MNEIDCEYKTTNTISNKLGANVSKAYVSLSFNGTTVGETLSATDGNFQRVNSTSTPLYSSNNQIQDIVKSSFFHIASLVKLDTSEEADKIVDKLVKEVTKSEKKSLI